MAEQHQAQQEQTAEELHELKRIRREKLAELQAAGADPYQQVRFERDHHTNEIHEHFDELEGKTVRLAGRMMSKTHHGQGVVLRPVRPLRPSAAVYQGATTSATRYTRATKRWTSAISSAWRARVFRTQKGEISVAVHELTLLSKSLTPLPRKVARPSRTRICATVSAMWIF